MDETGGSAGRSGKAGRWRIAAISAAAVVFLVLVGLAVWAVTGQGSKDAQEVAEKPDIEHALPTEPDDGSDETSGPVEASSTPEPGSNGGTGGASGGGSGAGSGAAGVIAHRNPLVAYRLGGALYVAAEDGSGAVRVAPSASGVFSLSPDGRSLAFVDLGTRELVIADVARGTTLKFGGAEQAAPVWAPTSKWLLFTGVATPETALSSVYRTDVLRAQRTGGAREVIASGRVAAVSPDARSVVIADIDENTTSGYSLKVTREGSSPRTLSVEGPVTGLATDGVVAYAAVSHVEAGQQDRDGIWVVPLDGGPATRLVTAPSTLRPVETRSLMLSPDGSRLMYATTGDDGYSRAAVVSASGGTPSELARRRDTYPLGWSADGSYVYFIEGNAWQGESTALVRTRPDGSGRTVIVQGAGM